MEIRKARLQDASNIYELVNSLSSDGTLLRRAFAEICENVRDFTLRSRPRESFRAAARCTSTGRTWRRCARSW